MGCASSKDVAVVADVAYRPPAASVSLFDVSAVEEPWLIAKKNAAAANGDHVEAEHSDDESEDDEEESESEEEEVQDAKKATTGVALPILDKLDGYELAPASWSEVSKALEDIKPTLDSKKTTDPKPAPKKKKKKKTKKQPAAQPEPSPPQKEQPPPQSPLVAGTGEAVKKAPPPATPYIHGSEGSDTKKALPELTGRRVVKENPFLLRDRETKNADGTAAAPKWRRRDPFEGYPERRPPGASGGGVVLYTTTLRGVRRTFEDCERARSTVEMCAEAAGLTVDERDVALHGEYLRELRELLLAEAEEQGAGVLPPPRLFVMGRYLGGAEACAELVDNGKLAEMLRWARARGEACAAKDGRGCEGCGGARFVPCMECGGSCKVVVGGDGSVSSGVVERCGKCNENGLMMCPICH